MHTTYSKNCHILIIRNIFIIYGNIINYIKIQIYRYIQFYKNI